MPYIEPIQPEPITDLEIVLVEDLELTTLVGLEMEIPVDLEMITLVASEMETPADLETEIQMVVSEMKVQVDSVILLLHNSQDTTMAVLDPVIPEVLETVADLIIIPVVVSDLVVHQAVAALEAVHPVVAVDLGPVASDNIQLHIKLLKK